MKGTEMITLIAKLIAAHGDKEIVIGTKKHASVNAIVRDHKATLVSAGEVSEYEVFTIIKGEQI